MCVYQCILCFSLHRSLFGVGMWFRVISGAMRRGSCCQLIRCDFAIQQIGKPYFMRWIVACSIFILWDVSVRGRIPIKTCSITQDSVWVEKWKRSCPWPVATPLAVGIVQPDSDYFLSRIWIMLSPSFSRFLFILIGNVEDVCVSQCLQHGFACSAGYTS